MFSRNTFLTAMVFCFSGSVLAQGATANSTAANEIANINENIAVLSARVKELDLRAQIVTKQAEIDRATVTGSTTNTDAAAPVVRGIEGVDGKLKATLAFTGGVQQTVSKGEATRGGWTVSDISINSVSLTRGKEKIKLGFGNEPPPVSPSASTTGRPL